MKAYNVKFLPHNREIVVAEGENLIRAAMEAGVHINASCGGEGVCGKCRVIVEEGQVDGGITEKLSSADREKGYRQACLATVKSDLVVRIPIESEIDASTLNRQATPRYTARIQQMDLSELKEKGLFVPPVEKKYIELPPPDASDNLSDVSRLFGFLKLKHNEHRLYIYHSVIQKLPDILREADFKVTVTIARPVRNTGRNRIINVQPGDTTDRNFAIAMDIGTTTIYGQLLNLITGEVLSQYGDFNAQISYGEDVISRIVFAEKEDGMQKLNRAVLKTINNINAKIIKRAKIKPEEISTITLAGNTTMTQLMLSVNPRYIRRSPYVPAASLYPPIRATDLGILLEDHLLGSGRVIFWQLTYLFKQTRASFIVKKLRWNFFGLALQSFDHFRVKI